jgi:hypothetical protein
MVAATLEPAAAVWVAEQAEGALKTEAMDCGD